MKAENVNWRRGGAPVPPLIEGAGLPQAAAGHICPAKHGGTGHGLGPGIDRLLFRLQILGPVRHQTPAQQVETTLAGLRV